jgi:hypothetical protein
MAFLRKSMRQRKRVSAGSFQRFLVQQAKFGKPLASRRKINKTKSMLRFFSLLGLSLMSYLPSMVACEGCKEPSNVAGDSGVGGISASFSWSVIFMLGMLAFLLTGMVLMMIRSCKQLAEQHHRLEIGSRHDGAAARGFASSSRANRDESPAAVRLWPQVS